MINQLNLQSTDLILEPCGGDGVFVSAILNKNINAKIDVWELNPSSISLLRENFISYSNVNIQQIDTILSRDFNLSSINEIKYDKIIANPPYGAWQDYEKRKLIKKIYPGIYTKESYALFLYRCIELLEQDGILTFIIPDTLLNLHMHKSLRNFILTKSKIKEIIMFPSSFFPGVNFGYANLLIITLKKAESREECLSNSFTIIKNFKNVDQIYNLDLAHLQKYFYKQSEVFSNPDHAFLISHNQNIIDNINSLNLKVGDIANCVTGFYSGNDKMYLKAKDKSLKNAKSYDLINSIDIHHFDCISENILEGIDGENCFVPIVKGGNQKYLKHDNWYMNWSKEAVSHYKKDKKARFQNSQYYFKYGIGVPMISSSSITASLIENKLFDQSIVGIFPKDPDLTLYLLAFFNSPTCNHIIRTINPSANNPSNYLKKIPFIFPSQNVKTLIDKKVLNMLNDIKQTNTYKKDDELELENIFKNLYGY